jgi:hypothetical protein
MDNSIAVHMITVFSILTFKLAVLVVGYLIARLGFELLVKGITGQFKFSAKLNENSADLISASPGIFFIFLAVTLISIAILKDKPFSLSLSGPNLQSEAEHQGGKKSSTLSDLPKNVPGE